jgi:5-formyltetrahydrofolate cyclo-ligase
MQNSPDSDSLATRLQAEKQARRKLCREVRDGIPAAERETASRIIVERVRAHQDFSAPRAVFVYVSTGSEVTTHMLIDLLAADGHRVLVPQISNNQQMEAVDFPGWQAMSPGHLGVLSPPESNPLSGLVEVALVPGLAFTLTGDRLGYGRGYYDRWLSAHDHVITLALAFEQQLVAGLPVGANDVPIANIITERRFIALPSPN